MRARVSTRILAGFAALLVAFAAVSTLVALRLRSTTRDLRVLGQGHLRLAFALNELEATQSSLVNLLGERQSIGLSTLRHMRLLQLQTARRISREALRLDPRNDDTNFLRRLTKDLWRLETTLRRNDADYQLAVRANAQLLAKGSPDISAFVRSENEVLRLMRASRDLTKGRVTELSLALSQAEGRAVWAALALIMAVLIVGVAAAVTAARTLRPLRQLAETARAIAGGHYSQRVRLESRDEIRDLAEEFNRMAAALEEREQRLRRSERLAAAGRVAAHVAHEIRNPLSSLGLNAELLEEELGDSTEAKRLLGNVRREVDRLEALTEEYLKFGRLPQPKLEPEDVPRLVRSLLEFLTPELEQSGIRVESRLCEVPLVAADEPQLRQALLNVLRNAREAMAEGGQLTVTTSAKNGHVEVNVRDTGPGIPENLRGRIFDPFFTTKKGGTGLGLALTHQIIAEHGGSVDVITRPSEGTTFIVKLPSLVAREASTPDAPA